jgi:hypothetical protein
VLGEATFPVLAGPVIVVESGAQILYGVADGDLLVGKREIHGLPFE